MKTIVTLLFTLTAFWSAAQSNVTVHDSIKLETDKIFDKLIEIRRDLHQHPELGGKEKRTQEVIKKYLLDLGLQVETDIYGYGLVGILKGGKKGKNIAWRADMDALPQDFPEPVTFISKIRGVQHGCGHDVHMTVALGIAEVLSKNKRTLAGTAYFIFQPEEETFNGAKGMVENGLFSKLKVDEIYGLHIIPALSGQILVKPNEVFAYQRRVRIKWREALAENTIQSLTTALKTSFLRVSGDAKPWEMQHILDPQKGLASPTSIYKDYAFVDDNYFSVYRKENEQWMDFYVYETDPKKAAEIIPKVKTQITQNGLQNKLVSVSFIQDNPTVVNDEKLTHASVKIIKEMYGPASITANYGQVPFSNDDFAYFQQKVPGVYFFLGGSNFQKGLIAMIHAPNFGVEEESIRTGVKVFSSLLCERMK
jgi:metal-dependent amidase/aminoacylase/carboxypeptidase family protein